MKTNDRKFYEKRMGTLNIILFVILVLYALSFLVLCTWGVFTSLKSRDDFYSNKVFWPSGSIAEWEWANFPLVLNNFFIDMTDPMGRRIRIDIWNQLSNTLLYAVGGGLVTTSCCCLASYLAAKFNYKFSKIVYTVVLVTMVIPIVGSEASMLAFLRQTKLYDTWIGTYMMKFNFMGLYFLVFHGVWSSISSEYAEAATIDGASETSIFLRIMLPLVSTTFYTIFLIQFIGYWNDYTTALVYMPTHPTLAYGVYYMSVSTIPGMSSTPIKMTSCVFLAAPIILVFVVFREKIMGNVTSGGVKE